MLMFSVWSVFPLAVFLLEVWLPYPRNWLHPVQAVGKLADMLEKPARRFAEAHPSSRPAAAPATSFRRFVEAWIQPSCLCNRLLFNGAVASLLVVLAACSCVFFLTGMPVLGCAAVVYFCWSGLALGALLREGAQALAVVESGALAEARAAVRMLVSRDTVAMEQPDLYRSLAESVSENLNDAFIAPFFWLVCFGPVGLWGYKAISTLDSMWGYTTERWLYFGRAAARLDDLLAYLPARLSVFFLLCTAPMQGNSKPFLSWEACRRCFSLLRRIRNDAAAMKSPNAGLPMAAAAWLHGAGMGGPTPYHGVMVDKPHLGPPNVGWGAESVRGLLRHIRRAGICAGVVIWAVGTAMAQ